MVTKLLPGELKVIKGGNTEFIAVDNGFAKVLGNTISVLVEAAIDVKDIDLSQSNRHKPALRKRSSKPQPKVTTPMKSNSSKARYSTSSHRSSPRAVAAKPRFQTNFQARFQHGVALFLCSALRLSVISSIWATHRLKNGLSKR